MKAMLTNSVARRTAALPLRHGQRLTQAEFHRRYEACPEDVKFELIGGVVYMGSPQRRRHGMYNLDLGGVLWIYKTATPGVEVLHNSTVILGEYSEPQPDLMLRILMAYGGRSRETADDYVQGPSELMSEIADSTKTIDLGRKRDDYERTGVLEYIVVSAAQKEFFWFHFPSKQMIEPNRLGIAKSRVFPGLWIDVPALLERDSARLQEVIQQGIASRSHAAFVKRLAKAHRRAK